MTTTVINIRDAPPPCHGDVLIAIAGGHLEFKGAIHAEG